MRFEQAFYTRGKNLLNEEEGLGIAAASKMEPQFWAKCMNIGGSFNTERSKEKAEFVIYSPQWDSFIGVGVNPANNEDGGVVNKLCHIYIPTEVSHIPNEYYLEYPFEAQVEKGSKLEEVELQPYLKEERFTEIRQKYGFEKEKLAEFLFQLYPILMKEQKLLLVVLDGEIYKKENCFTIAREITWLASYLVPALEKDAFTYRKRLTYGANTKDNLSIVNLVFSTDESLSANCFYLETSERKKVPQLYEQLAEKACASQEDFLQFLAELYEKPLGEDQDIKNLTLRYLRWKLEQGMKPEWEELSSYLLFIRRKARNDGDYQAFLYRCLLSLEDIAVEELLGIWRETIKFVLNKKDVELGESFLLLTAELLERMYEKDKNHYKRLWKELSNEVQKTVMEQLYTKESSCIHKHIEQLETFQDYEEVIELYQELCGNVKFLTDIAKRCVKNYFDMIKKEREYFSSIFEKQEETKWRVWIETDISEAFQKDSYLEWFRQEMDKIEDCYILRYFSELLEKCKQESEKSRIETIIELAETYLQKYDKKLTKTEEKAQYETWKLNWDREQFLKCLEGRTLKELAEMDIRGKKPILREDWCKALLSSLDGECLTMEVLRALLEQRTQLEDMPEILFTYQEKLWKLCEMDLEKCFACSIAFGVETFSVWSGIQIFSFKIEEYEQVYAVIESNPAYRIIEEQSLKEETWECNRLSYLLWKQLIKLESEKISVDIDFYLKHFQDKAQDYIAVLKKMMLEKAEKESVLNYFRLEYGMKTLERTLKTVRCNKLEQIWQEYPKFCEALLKMEVENSYVKEAKLYYALCQRECVTETNILECKKLLDTVKNYFGTEVERVRSFEKEYKKVVSGLMSQVTELETKIREVKGNKAKNEQKIKALKLEIANLERENRKFDEEVEAKRKRQEELRSTYREAQGSGKEKISSFQQKQEVKKESYKVIQKNAEDVQTKTKAGINKQEKERIAAGKEKIADKNTQVWKKQEQSLEGSQKENNTRKWEACLRQSEEKYFKL